MTNYADGNPKDAIGKSKPGLSDIPLWFLWEIGKAMRDGKNKYGHFNWRAAGTNLSVYLDAMWRHITAWLDGEERAQDSGVHHLAHAAACLIILADAKLHGKLKDDIAIPVVGGVEVYRTKSRSGSITGDYLESSE